MPSCPDCAAEVLDIDVKCGACGRPLGTTGAHQLLGATVLGQYVLEEVLGQGGMSVVYRGRHQLTGQEVALKLLPPELAAHSQVKSRFVEEARALAQLDHPNIVHLYNFGQENGAFVLAMQLVSGQTWERMILAAGRQPWPDAVRISVDVLRALEYAHSRGIVHRDMKPSNVLVRDADGAATVMDFGIAKMTTSTRLTATGQTMGTVRYMSPEQVRGQEVDLRTDVYSLGATLYEALVGDTPFDGETHFEIMTRHLQELPVRPTDRGIDLPSALDAVVLKALAKKPEQRFADAREFRKALEAVVARAQSSGELARSPARESTPPPVRPPAPDPVAVTAPMPAPMPPLQRRPPTGSPLDGPAARDAQLAATAPAATAAAATAPGAEAGAPRSATAPVRRRSRGAAAALAAGVVVAVAGAAVAVLSQGGGSPAAPPVAASIVDAAPAPPDAVPAFVPPGLTVAASVSIPAGAPGGTVVSVRVTREIATTWPAAEVAEAWQRARQRFEAFASEHAALVTLPASLTVVVVPALTLCDSRIYDSGKAEAGCRTQGFYYRAVEQTLLVADDRLRLEAHLGLGLADAACLSQAMGAKVCALVPEFTAQVLKGM